MHSDIPVVGYVYHPIGLGFYLLYTSINFYTTGLNWYCNT